MRLLFAGTPDVATPALDALIHSDHEVVAVLTRPPARVGRKRVLTPSPVQQRATDLGIAVITSDSPHEEPTLAQLRSLSFDCAAVVAYGALLREPALSLPPGGWVNLHFSLLPAWRGAAPVQRALMAGEDVVGATTFRIEAGLDSGPVYATMTQRVHPTDTAGDLLATLATAAAPLLVSTMDAIADGSAHPVRQPTDGVTWAPVLTSADAAIDWNLPAHVVDTRIRGLTPTPGAWTTYQGSRFKIGPVRPAQESIDLNPGVVQVRDGQVLVGTGTDAVRLTDLAPPGKSWMSAQAWARGARIEQPWSFDPSQKEV
ncbi:MAG: methionyl-tRNA formyltransferase [Beutenbergiaceae bacterium]